jgi:uncharacterized protein YdcH (DUF465 family)
MLGESHSILKEFPEYKEVIFRLLKDNLHFSSLSSQYHELDNKIIALEEVGVPISDSEFSQIKMRRAEFKDELYQLIVIRAQHEKS